MTPKARVQAALAKQPVDRVPVFMWFHPDTARHLSEVLEIPAGCVGEAMGDDIRQAWVNNNYPMCGITHEHDGEGHTDEWGIRWVKHGGFNQIEHSPIQDAGPEDIQRYAFPYDKIDALLTLMDTVVPESENHFVGCDVSPCAFEMYWRLRGMEQGMLDLAGSPEVAGELIRRCADFAEELARRACAKYALDWLWTGDDVAGQQGMLMSPSMWRELVQPHLERVIRVGQSHGLPIAYHSCGAVRPIIADLIDSGVNILNPIQCNCPGMDPLELKREFGTHLAFMGGVDTQDLLPHGSVKQVRAATQRLIEGMTADGGGYILAASHTVPPETPLDNIFAMYEVAGITRTRIHDAAADIRARLSNTAR
ncbi:MAG: hypothetical protein IT440_11590 [Phycisphaeraceae bacterium]|nr:hypothetical protein [Phycisphaeraceae bacterium]